MMKQKKRKKMMINKMDLVDQVLEENEAVETEIVKTEIEDHQDNKIEVKEEDKAEATKVKTDVDKIKNLNNMKIYYI